MKIKLRIDDGDEGARTLFNMEIDFPHECSVTFLLGQMSRVFRMFGVERGAERVTKRLLLDYGNQFGWKITDLTKGGAE